MPDPGNYATLCPNCATLPADAALRAANCPANAAVRLAQLRRSIVNTYTFQCPRFSSPDGTTQGPGSWSSFNRPVDKVPASCIHEIPPAGDVKYTSYEMRVTMQPCTFAELQALLDEAGQDLDAAASKLQTDIGNVMPQITERLRSLLNEKMVQPVLDLMSAEKMDCA